MKTKTPPRVQVQNRTVSIESIKPHPENYRLHPEEQLGKLGASYQRFGQFRSVVLQETGTGDYLLVAGHGIVEAMRREHVTEVRADVLGSDVPSMTIKAIMVADNVTAQSAEDDLEALTQLLQEQLDAGFPLETLGSSVDDLEALLQELEAQTVGNATARDADDPTGGGDDFDAEPEEGQTRVQYGDLWACGKHRILCGDSTNPGDVKRLMNGERAVMMATDPPYGDSWVEKARDMQAHGSIENDGKTGDELKRFLIAFLEVAKLAGDAPMPFYVWHRAKRIIFEQALVESGYFVHQPIVWVKPGFVIGRLHYHPRCEWALHGWRQGNGSCPFYGERNQSDVWEVARENDKIHPTQKPLALFVTPLENHTHPGEICYEPFAGSGTQIIAAERLGRRCFAIEVDPRYVNVVLTRYTAETNEEPVLLERLSDSADEKKKDEV